MKKYYFRRRRSSPNLLSERAPDLEYLKANLSLVFHCLERAIKRRENKSKYVKSQLWLWGKLEEIRRVVFFLVFREKGFVFFLFLSLF